MQYRFGRFVLDGDRFELSGDEEGIALEPKNFQLLQFLIQNRNRVLTKDEILGAVWPGVIVTDASLSTAIGQIRKAVGDDGQAQKFIKTIRGRGFRFVADVEEGAARVPAEAASPDLGEETAQPAQDGRPVIAVLPFTLLGADAGQQAIAEAIPGELIATLSRLRWVKVIARGSSFQFSGADLGGVRSKLNAGYVLSGSVELKQTRITVIVELTDTDRRELVWGEHYAGALDDVYALREKIGRDVTNGLELRLPLHEAERLKLVPSENLDAWGHFHLGVRHMYHYRGDDNQIAQDHFKRALALDRQFARAHAALSYTEFQNYFQMFWSDLERHRGLALKHAEEAAALDPLDPFGNLTLGRAKWRFGDVENGMGWVSRALQLNPNYSFAFYNSAIFNAILCETPSADAHVDTAIELSPLDPHLQSMLGIKALSAFISGDVASAADLIEQSMRAPNPHLYVFIIAAVIYARLDNFEKANAYLDMIRQKNAAFGREELLSHYNLRDPSAKAEMIRALDRLGV